MATKPKTDGKVTTLKGQQAEDKILEYLKRMNRPYGAVDVAANLKGAVPKATTQKILVALAEKGELTQKTYGKTTFFVANQANRDVVPPENLALSEAELKSTEQENKMLGAEVKALTAELSKAKSTPTDDELHIQISGLEDEISRVELSLNPLRSGAPPISAEEIQSLQAEWGKWKTQWFIRRKIFQTLWNLATDALPLQEAIRLGEDLGIEKDTPEHGALERGPLCTVRSLKRKRA